ncbi:MAG TPA: putative toxin-antitoxin system toxin component, PIN family [Azospirillum sp.]|nr:putative toxin-antitoxin system toxin component, PIN family [Azospirillum sp.]
MSTPPLRAVLDTNVLVAYALLPDAVPRRLRPARDCVEAVRARGVMLASEATLTELRTVLLRPDFDTHKPRAEREAFLASIEAGAERVVPAALPRTCKDPDDDKFLAVALAGAAGWLLTEDKALLALRTIGATRILRPIVFLKEVTLAETVTGD